jgi:RNA polymerase sigma-70 factor (sigma-E family)
MARNVGAFTEFAAAQTRPLLRTAWLMTGDWHLAQDLVQDTLARMFETWDRAGGLDSPGAYAHVVLVRTYISKRRRRSFFEQPSEIVQERAALGDQVEVRVVLREALAGLRPGDRAVLVLRYLLDRSVEQVAYDLAISPAAVRARCKRALDRLRLALGDRQLLDLAVDDERTTQ